MHHSSALAVAAALLATCLASGCDRSAENPKTSAIPTDQTSQSTTAAPPGDSTPKAADSQTRVANEANEKGASGAGSQTTVGTAASGAPPYSLQGAPEGNAAPKGGDEPKK